MSEKLEQLAEAQAAVSSTEEVLAAVRRLTHAATFGQVRTMRLSEPQTQLTALSTIDRNVLLAALRVHEETALAQVHATDPSFDQQPLDEVSKP
ncbi:hypothetical protein [Leucobacter komagatae]|uniref:Uncharacterized protein n=1 Tax=Leucobacter komagatae TaxID=55969 RepID=A0A0D0H2V0_9MICO|nr:hypothetical protein [Leucobacter komagatae]KIP51465.1 hypothetical protein SD72_15205 [Leucobacter komagatae]